MTLDRMAQQLVKPMCCAQDKRHSLIGISKICERLFAEYFAFGAGTRDRALIGQRQLDFPRRSGWDIQRPRDLVDSN